MRHKKRTITINETATLLSLKFRSSETRRGWCSECEAEVIWIEPSTAMELFGMTSLTHKCVIHFSDGRVCTRSLSNFLNHLNKEK